MDADLCELRDMRERDEESEDDNIPPPFNYLKTMSHSFLNYNFTTTRNFEFLSDSYMTKT